LIRPKNIRTRLALWYSGVLGLILLGVVAGVSLFFLRGLREEFDRTLTENFERAARHLEVHTDGTYGMRKPEKSSTRDFAEEMPVEVWTPNGDLLYRSPAWTRSGLGSPVPVTTAQQKYAIVGERSANERFRIMTGETSSGDQKVVVRVAASEERVWHEVKELLGVFLFIVPLALILAGFAGYWMAAKALRPVEAMGKRARDISAENLSDRLPVSNPDDELGGLAQVINGLLSRLEKSFEELRRFTSDASHELRTPLQALRSLGEVALQSEQPTGYYRDVISSMLEETDRMSKLTHSLLTLSRADSGNYRLQKTKTSLPAMLEEIRSFIGILAEEKGQKLTVQVDSEALAEVDPVIFRQAVVNLIDNAIKYSPEGSEIRVRVGADGMRQAIVEVKDQGIGISDEHRARIFDRFYRVDKSRSRDLGGSGLGLSIAKWAVEAHGGTIELDSLPDQGSSFRILVPLH